MTKTLTIVLSLFLSGCAGATATVFKPLPAKPENCAMQVFPSKDEVHRKYETVCVVEARTSTRAFTDRSMGAAIEFGRPELCKCGADAAIVLEGNSDRSTAFSPTEIEDRRGQVKLSGIRFLDNP